MAQGTKRRAGTATDEPIAVQLQRLLEANHRLREEFEQSSAAALAWRDERALLLAMLNEVPDYLFAKGLDGKFVMANRAVAKDLGYEHGEDVVGLTDFEMQPDPEVARKFVEDDQKVIQSGRAKLDIEEFMIDAHGDKQWLSTSKVPLRNEAGEIIGLVGVARNVTERKRAEDQVHYLAYHDVLTGLPNRMLFDQMLEQALAGAGRGRRAALVYLDLDRFKNVNDTLGHPAGDELIREVAGRLSALGRSGDTVARLGGDEFAIVMADVKSVADVEPLVRRILKELSRPFDIHDNQVFVNASVGIAVSDDGKIDSNEMLRQADIALYRAKARGRGRYEIFAQTMAVAVVESRRIEQDLRQAIATGVGLHALYQPVVDATGRKMIGAEALVRWNHPSRGLLGPQTFISVAEERGLIDAVGEIVLREAAETAGRAKLPWIAVNVSPIQFRGEHFADSVLRILAEMKLDPRRLQLEITESVLLESSDALQATISRLKSAGIAIALDDFGTGYSSMNYLRRYNVDKLKIDRSFVSQLGSNTDMGPIITAMVALGRAMNIRVTAEGVETKTQAKLLAAMGCHELQGFLYAKPMNADAIAKLFAKV
jgi:diguanylate cyclase (GGDEF)-like protein/PAS domain S-box-containing protein